MSVKNDVDRGLEIVATIAELQDELKAIEARIERAGLNGPQFDLLDAEREGKQYLACGTVKTVPVVFTSDLIVKSFTDGSDTHDRILAVASARLSDFYKPVRAWKTLFDSGVMFRRKAVEILGDKGPEFITACVMRDKHGIPRSQVKIEWNRAEETK